MKCLSFLVALMMVSKACGEPMLAASLCDPSMSDADCTMSHLRLRVRQEGDSGSDLKRETSLFSRMPAGYGKRDPDTDSLIIEEESLPAAEKGSSGLGIVLQPLEVEGEGLKIKDVDLGQENGVGKDGLVSIGDATQRESHPSLQSRIPVSYSKPSHGMERDGRSEGRDAGTKRALLDRMPLSFGKRAPRFRFPALYSEVVGLPGRPDQSHSKRRFRLSVRPLVLSGAAKQALIRRLLKYGKRGHRLENTKRALLDRMPFTYGKRESSPGLESLEQHQIDLHGKRALLENMPTQYGKRDSVSAEDSAEMKRALLNRMPLSYDKKASDDSTIENGLLLHHMQLKVRNLWDQTEKRALLDRMPLNFGKRDSSLAEDGEDDEDDKKRSVVDRMPLSFGKRLKSEGNTFSYDPLSNDKRGVLDRMAAGYGKRDPDPEFDKRGLLDRMPLNFGKRKPELEETEFEDNAKRGLLDRMPLNYGKRDLESESSEKRTADESLVNSRPDLGASEEINPDENAKEPMKTCEGKQGCEDRLPWNLREGGPGALRRLHFRLKTLGNGLRWYLKRAAVLNRMPQSFGKRSVRQVGESASNSLNITPSKMRRRVNGPLLRPPLQLKTFRKGLRWYLKRGAVLNRMPLSFGKRRSSDIHRTAASS